MIRWLKPGVAAVLLGGMLSMCAGQKSRGPELTDLAPQAIAGWTVGEPDRLMEGDAIFDYIDGAGEIYKAYGYQRLFARTYTRDGSPRILADLFDMGEGRGAYGIFTHNLEGEAAGIGQGSLYEGGLLSFWKGRYFVSLFTEEESEAARRAVLRLGEDIADAIVETAPTPAIVARLPRRGLEQARIRYFFNHLILNGYFFLADDNILNLGPECEAALGSYGGDLEGTRLLLVEYPEAARAQAAERNFRSAYLPEAESKEGVRTETGLWTAVRRSRLRLAIVFEAPGPEAARALLDAGVE